MKICVKKIPKYFLLAIQGNEMVRSFGSPKCLLFSGRKNGRSNIKTVDVLDSSFEGDHKNQGAIPQLV